VDNDKDAPPPMIRALLEQLVIAARIPQKNIVIYDATRVIPNRIYDPRHERLPRRLQTQRQGNRQPRRARTLEQREREEVQPQSQVQGKGYRIVYRGAEMIPRAISSFPSPERE